MKKKQSSQIRKKPPVASLESSTALIEWIDAIRAMPWSSAWSEIAALVSSYGWKAKLDDERSQDHSLVFEDATGHTVIVQCNDDESRYSITRTVAQAKNKRLQRKSYDEYLQAAHAAWGKPKEYTDYGKWGQYAPREPVTYQWRFFPIKDEISCARDIDIIQQICTIDFSPVDTKAKQWDIKVSLHVERNLSTQQSPPYMTGRGWVTALSWLTALPWPLFEYELDAVRSSLGWEWYRDAADSDWQSDVLIKDKAEDEDNTGGKRPVRHLTLEYCLPGDARKNEILGLLVEYRQAGTNVWGVATPQQSSFDSSLCWQWRLPTGVTITLGMRPATLDDNDHGLRSSYILYTTITVDTEQQRHRMSNPYGVVPPPVAPQQSTATHQIWDVFEEGLYQTLCQINVQPRQYTLLFDSDEAELRRGNTIIKFAGRGTECPTEMVISMVDFFCEAEKDQLQACGFVEDDEAFRLECRLPQSARKEQLRAAAHGCVVWLRDSQGVSEPSRLLVWTVRTPEIERDSWWLWRKDTIDPGQLYSANDDLQQAGVRSVNLHPDNEAIYRQYSKKFCALNRDQLLRNYGLSDRLEDEVMKWLYGIGSLSWPMTKHEALDAIRQELDWEIDTQPGCVNNVIHLVSPAQHRRSIICEDKRNVMNFSVDGLSPAEAQAFYAYCTEYGATVWGGVDSSYSTPRQNMITWCRHYVKDKQIIRESCTLWHSKTEQQQSVSITLNIQQVAQAHDHDYMTSRSFINVMNWFDELTKSSVQLNFEAVSNIFGWRNDRITESSQVGVLAAIDWPNEDNSQEYTLSFTFQLPDGMNTDDVRVLWQTYVEAGNHAWGAAQLQRDRHVAHWIMPSQDMPSYKRLTLGIRPATEADHKRQLFSESILYAKFEVVWYEWHNPALDTTLASDTSLTADFAYPTWEVFEDALYQTLQSFCRQPRQYAIMVDDAMESWKQRTAIRLKGLGVVDDAHVVISFDGCTRRTGFTQLTNDEQQQLCALGFRKGKYDWECHVPKAASDQALRAAAHGCVVRLRDISGITSPADMLNWTWQLPQLESASRQLTTAQLDSGQPYMINFDLARLGVQQHNAQGAPGFRTYWLMKKQFDAKMQVYPTPEQYAAQVNRILSQVWPLSMEQFDDAMRQQGWRIMSIMPHMKAVRWYHDGALSMQVSSHKDTVTQVKICFASQLPVMDCLDLYRCYAQAGRAAWGEPVDGDNIGEIEHITEDIRISTTWRTDMGDTITLVQRADQLDVSIDIAKRQQPKTP